jgi:hypothetical protein
MPLIFRRRARTLRRVCLKRFHRPMHYPSGTPMSEESFLRYRLEVVQLMPESAYKNALLAAIRSSLAALGASHAPARAKVAAIGYS